jgi:hypothetical protein
VIVKIILTLTKIESTIEASLTTYRGLEMNAKQATAIVSGVLATGLFIVGFLSAMFGETGTAISYMTASIVATILYIITMDKE